jgi:hypothetical protein
MCQLLNFADYALVITSRVEELLTVIVHVLAVMRGMAWVKRSAVIM